MGLLSNLFSFFFAAIPFILLFGDEEAPHVPTSTGCDR